MKKAILFLMILSLFAGLWAKKIVIYHTNDIKNVLGSRNATFINPDFPPVLGGIYSLSTAVKWERDKAEKNQDIFLLFDSGNFAYKSVENDSVDFSVPAVYFEHMKYDLVNLGLDELSAGGAFAEKAKERMRTPLILGNIFYKDKGYIFDRYKIIEVQGIKIGVFGLTSEYAGLNLTENAVSDIIVQRETDAAKELVAVLKKNRCDIIIGLTSTSYEHDIVLADEVEGIDVILSGNEGRGMRESIETPVNHTIIIKGYGELSSVEKITLEIDDTGNILFGEGISVTLFEDAFPADKELKAKLNK
ncbi:TPA: hypothetical protein DCW38_06360 [candidate division WOR-3 bacterium]|jgi:2',3'-cyclic-nucleotide 2'-phosphodiesterase (5'-nucleotidase family)|uniref:Bifunctional metallophosphatase/5'-nucleotidase n=1 Tax=candidate division WOR-3 bacterium TaxID=2052148 RepID=A0A350HB69_UNCW3|nr:hypothetical protein [candidate division WOR-3 bacterium]